MGGYGVGNAKYGDEVENGSSSGIIVKEDDLDQALTYNMCQIQYDEYKEQDSHDPQHQLILRRYSFQSQASDYLTAAGQRQMRHRAVLKESLCSLSLSVCSETETNFSTLSSHN